MHLVYGLWILSFLSKTYLIVIFILLFSIKLISSYKKEALKWIMISLVFLGLKTIHFPDFFSNYRIIHTTPYKAILRNGFNHYELKGVHDFELDDRVSVDKISLYEDPNHYERTNRIKGRVYLDDLTHIKRPFSPRRIFLNQLSDPLKMFFNHETETVLSLLSIQLMGLLSVLQFLFKKYMTKKQMHLLELGFILIYGYFFGFRFGVVRLLLKNILKTKEKILPVLLCLYPYAFYDVGFNLVYLPLLLKGLSPYFNVNYLVLRSYFILYLFGRIQILELLLYPFWKVYSGLILLLSFLFQTRLAEFLLRMGLKVLSNQRLLIVGSPSIIWIIFFLFQSQRKQIQSFLVMCLFMTYVPYTRVSMINVYQGDATFIALPFNSISILIDTGRTSAYNTLKKSLYKQGIKQLDYLIITHDDLDHMENKEMLMEEFGVKYLIETKDQKVPFMMQLLQEVTYEDENDNSLIFYFKTKQASFMFMGDAGIPQEKEIIKAHPFLNVDVLKLGHHGSKTSSSTSFLESLRPKIALISSDPRVYNHPHPEVMNNLQSFRITPLQTSEQGNVEIRLYPFMKVVVSQRGGFGIMK